MPKFPVGPNQMQCLTIAIDTKQEASLIRCTAGDGKETTWQRQ